MEFRLGRRTGRTGTTLIPVVIHVVHFTSVQDVSTGQIQSQIDALNRDFGRRNEDLADVPEPWKALAADSGITFALADQDPSGNPTDGITRTPTNISAFPNVDEEPMKHADRGGADAWPADRYLNVWVCPLQNLLGYAQFPGGPTETDGVVIEYRAFGTTGTAEAPFDHGRTAVHEVGHWLNLYHIWGDDGMGCAGTDNVDDTPNQAGPNVGRPIFPRITCDNGPNGDMFVNHMDYSDDSAMLMFTEGQVTRMQAALAGPRSSFPQQPQGPQPTEQWSHNDLTVAADAPTAAGDPAVYTSLTARSMWFTAALTSTSTTFSRNEARPARWPRRQLQTTRCCLVRWPSVRPPPTLPIRDVAEQ